MAIRAWVHCVGPDREGTEKEIVSFLAENGVEIRNFDPYVIRDYGVLLFGEFSVELCDFLREASPGCRERILAGSCAQLSAEHAWKLMQAGAADVLHCRQCLQSVRSIIARLMRWEMVDRMMMTPRVQHQLRRGITRGSFEWLGRAEQHVPIRGHPALPRWLIGASQDPGPLDLGPTVTPQPPKRSLETGPPPLEPVWPVADWVVFRKAQHQRALYCVG